MWAIQGGLLQHSALSQKPSVQSCKVDAIGIVCQPLCQLAARDHDALAICFCDGHQRISLQQQVHGAVQHGNDESNIYHFGVQSTR